MGLALGVDTGGTYTDAVLIRDEHEIVASAKALTTRWDLAEGVRDAVAAVLQEVAPEKVGMAALSTTLATNALVEGQGGRVGLIYIGFGARDLETQGLSEALRGDPVVLLRGGHGAGGEEVAALDEESLRAFLTEADVSAFAVAGRFATRNTAHELRALELVAELSGRPATASHQLSARLGGPKRALTAVLNARLLGLIDGLIGRAGDALQALGVTAPLMVVRGDGALMSAAAARKRPIETILSGPAASLVGARWLTGATDALVSDIGGTTTDIALLRDGRPAIDPDGARVGAHRTMVEAVAMRTFGLGGDSEVHLQTEGLAGGVTLGPLRVLPLSLLGAEAPELVRATLEAQLSGPLPGEYDARFVRAVPKQVAHGLGDREATILERIGDGIRPMGEVLKNRLEDSALQQLVRRGLVQLGAITPSDAAHVLGMLDCWDVTSARLGLEILARRRIGSGEKLSQGAAGAAEKVLAAVRHQSEAALLGVALSEDGFDPALSNHSLVAAGLSHHQGVLTFSAGLAVPIIGLGASAQSYYAPLGQRLGTDVILPEHGRVANAIGAVVGRVSVRRTGQVTKPAEGRFRAHINGDPVDFSDEGGAIEALVAALRDAAQDEVRAAGASDIETRVEKEVRDADVEGVRTFVEADVSVEVTGRPRISF